MTGQDPDGPGPAWRLRPRTAADLGPCVRLLGEVQWQAPARHHAQPRGLLLMVWVTAAHVTDRQAARAMLPVLRTRFREITLVWADGGHTGRLATWAKEKLQLTLQMSAQPSSSLICL